MTSALVSAFYEGANNDVFGTYNTRSAEPFSPTGAFPMNFEQRLGSVGINEIEEFKRQTSVPNLQLMRSLSVSSKPADLTSFCSDSVFTSNNIFNNSKESRPRDRAFSESDRNLRNNTQCQQQQHQPQQNSNRYKTELCRPFMENGKCKYGDKCQFAHGGHEIRNLQRHPKYKTELCRTYHTVGICPYGPRCHFIHNPVERKMSATSPKQRRERTVERPKLLPFNSMPLGSTGDLTPPPSVCDSPFSPLGFPEMTEDHFLEVLKAKAKELATGEQSDLLLSPRGMSPTLPSPITSAPPSPFIPGQTFALDVQLKDNVFFSNGLNSKPPSPVSYRPPTPPDSDPETYSDRSTSPPGTAGRRLPIFRVMSMEEYR